MILPKQIKKDKFVEKMPPLKNGRPFFCDNPKHVWMKSSCIVHACQIIVRSIGIYFKGDNIKKKAIVERESFL